MPHIVVATGMLPAQFSGQWRFKPLRRECQQASVRYFVQAMAEGIVGAQGQASPLLRIGSLQSVVDAVGAGAELGDGCKALVERLPIGKGREASVADGLIAVELLLKGLVQSARSHIVGAHAAVRAGLLLNAEIVLVVVRRLERSSGKGVQAYRQRTGSLARLDASARRAAGTKRRASCRHFRR